MLGGEDLPHTRPPPTDGQRTAEVPLSAGDPLNHPLETSYCLYKLEHFDRARAVIQRARDAAMDPEALDRGLLLLEAQTVRRRRSGWAEPRSSTDSRSTPRAAMRTKRCSRPSISWARRRVHSRSPPQDSPEQADLETNIAACSSHLDFLASIPARLAEEAVDVAALESTPLVAVLPQPVRRPAAASAVPEPPKLSKTAARRKNRPIKLPPSIAALPESERPAPDPLRWVKKEKVAKRGRSRAQERARVAAATQGGQATAGAATGGTPARRKGGKK